MLARRGRAARFGRAALGLRSPPVRWSGGDLRTPRRANIGSGLVGSQVNWPVAGGAFPKAPRRRRLARRSPLRCSRFAPGSKRSLIRCRVWFNAPNAIPSATTLTFCFLHVHQRGGINRNSLVNAVESAEPAAAGGVDRRRNAPPPQGRCPSVECILRPCKDKPPSALSLLLEVSGSELRLLPLRFD